MRDHDATPADRAIALATQFLNRVWGPAHDLDAIDELMAEDYRIWSGGKLVSGRSAFKDWVRKFQSIYGNAHTEIQETFANEKGDRVVSRWFNTGVNTGCLASHRTVDQCRSRASRFGEFMKDALPSVGLSVPPSRATRALPNNANAGQYLYINPKNNVVVVGLGPRPKPVGKQAIDDLDFLAAVVEKLRRQ
jgi:CubicO group peptidase (beta-lactamase class C family)